MMTGNEPLAGEQAAPSSDPGQARPAGLAPAEWQGIALAVIAVLAVVFMLSWGRAVWIPVMFGILLSYALSPIVDRMQCLRIPRAIGAAVLLLAIVSGLGALAYSLQDDAAELIETLPEAARNFRLTLRNEGLGSPHAIEQVREAAAELERVARDAGVQQAATPEGVTRVHVEKPPLTIYDYLWKGTLGAAGLAGQAAIVLFLVYFLLMIGDTFRRKLVKITGPALSHKKITVQVLDEITEQIQRYLLVQIATSALVGIASWLAFRAVGLEHAAIWGIAAAAFNTIPYVGPILVTAGIGVVALLQFGTLSMAALVAGLSLLITSLEGYLLTPWLSGRAGRINPAVVFVGVLFWGWLWGVWGLLLGIPIIMVIKSICDRVEDLKPIGELLGE